MVCPLCGGRKAKRACPALGKQICAVCCGTKRLVEIRCPNDCVYLTAARTHPPAVVQKQLDQDRALLLPLVSGLNDRQARLFLMYGGVVIRHQPETFQRLIDDDIAQAAQAHAATLETAGRGIVYDHRPSTLSAERLLIELKALTAEMAREGGTSLERDAAVALRRFEAGARECAKRLSGSTAFQQLLVRMLSPQGGPAESAGSSGEKPGAGKSDLTAPAPSLILPPS